MQPFSLSGLKQLLQPFMFMHYQHLLHYFQIHYELPKADQTYGTH